MTAEAAGGDYRQLLVPTPHGWPKRQSWCVWIEPAAADGPAARWDQLWLQAVEAALASWAELVTIHRSESRESAQVQILRRRPPLQRGRASHGRAELALATNKPGDPPKIEPRVLVSISPGQRPDAIQATALHELGHAFGMWGHSDQPQDAMAGVPGPTPVLQLTARDRATFMWLQQQPGLPGSDSTAAGDQVGCH
ncbi:MULTISPECIES: peptidase [unclassified Cyanobium]|uniref:peptidase n=1 Tax=unclassified Cyanobium TaxID=2627006 RepID=UPI0020CD5486|nr:MULTISPECIES: peptidase [unclassified Cyanobium]